MKLFGFAFGKEKPMPFPAFRDHVRLITRKALPGAQCDSRDYGFVLVREGKPPTTCNLRGPYLEYTRNRSALDQIVARWISALTMEIPAHTWDEARLTLRPILKNSGYLAHAHAAMRKNTPPDVLPSAPFVGDLSIIVMRELPGTIVAVTQNTLTEWNVTFGQAMRCALDNLNMNSFPTLATVLHTGATAKNSVPRDEVGLVFEGDHLTASWLVTPRFRDYLTQRLQGEFVAYVPTRNRLTAVRADEPGLISKVQAGHRNSTEEMLWLTSKGFHVSGAQIGGCVSIYKPPVDRRYETAAPPDPFAGDFYLHAGRTAAVRYAERSGLPPANGLAESTEVARSGVRHAAPARQ